MLFEEKLNQKVAKYGSYWREPPLNYAELKRLIYDATNGSDAEERRQAFFVALDAEIRRLNKTFGQMARAAVREYQPRKAIMTDDNKQTTLGSSNGIVPEVSLARVCSEYAKVNVNGVRKILKKCDKEWDGKEGMEYWMRLWKNQTDAVAFVHSPIRVQLDAIESVDAWIGHRSSTGKALMEGKSFAPKNRLTQADLTCPICLELLYMPVALSCGHVYCFRCLMKSCDLGKAIGTTQALMSNIHPHCQCAKCRQKNVCHSATIIPELETYVRLHSPEAWKERKAREERDEAEKQRELAVRRAQKVKRMGFFVRPTDFLY